MERWQEARPYYDQSLAIELEIGDIAGAILTHRAIALLSIRLGACGDAAPHFAQALGLALRVNPYPAFQTAGRMQYAAGRLLATGQAAAAAEMAAAGLRVVEQMQGRLRGNKQQAAALCGAVLEVIGQAALGQRDQALALARR